MLKNCSKYGKRFLIQASGQGCEGKPKRRHKMRSPPSYLSFQAVMNSLAGDLEKRVRVWDFEWHYLTFKLYGNESAQKVFGNNIMYVATMKYNNFEISPLLL